MKIMRYVMKLLWGAVLEFLKVAALAAAAVIGILYAITFAKDSDLLKQDIPEASIIKSRMADPPVLHRLTFSPDNEDLLSSLFPDLTEFEDRNPPLRL